MKKVMSVLSVVFLSCCCQAAAQVSDIPDPAPDNDLILLDSEAPADPLETRHSRGQPEDRFGRDSLRLDPVICPFKGAIEYRPGDFDCFLLEVPENREDPDSRFIELHVVRLNARWDREGFKDNTGETGLDAGRRDDPVIYLTGGPGVKASYYVEKLRNHGILDHRDMYILEQRGIGFSDDFCPLYSNRLPSLNESKTFSESQEAGQKRFRLCAENARAAGIDLRGYNTIENARDVKALRRALGLDNWNVWGISYGSILGQAYVKEDPEGIRAVALDAIMPLDVRDSDEHWRVVKWYVRDLDKLQDICDAQPGCADRYPAIRERLERAVRSLAEDPIEIEVQDVEVFPSGKARLFQDVAAFLPFMFLYEQQNYPAMPALVYAWADALERRDQTLMQALVIMMSGGGFFSSSEGMSNAIHCADGGTAAQARANRRDAAEFPILGSVLGDEKTNRRRVALCAELGMPLRDGRQYAAVQTDLPSLIIEGEMDPITPPPNAKAILPGFVNGTYVEFPYAGHGPSRSVNCGGAMLNRFFDNPQADPDLSCVKEMETPEMIVPIYESGFLPRIQVLQSKGKKKLLLPGLWLGLPLAILLTASLVLTFSPLLRSVDGRTAPSAGTARILAWAGSLVSITSVAILGASAGLAAEVSSGLVLFGFLPWGVFGAWMGLAAGLLGLWTIAATIRARGQHDLLFSSMLGYFLTGAAAIALSAFLLAWDLGPF